MSLSKANDMKPFYVIPLLLLPTLAFGGTNTLRKVQVTDGSRIDLFFDSKVDPRHIKTEFFNDIIQVSLNDVSVYPAKISSVSGMELTKVFAYQYAPKLTRCRLTVKGRAESYQARFETKASGKVLSLRLQAAGAEQVAQAAPKAERYNEEEKELLKRVLDNTPVAEGGRAGAPQPAAAQAQQADAIKTSAAASIAMGPQNLKNQDIKLGGGKPLPSPLRSFVMLAVVIGIFGAMAFVVRKAKGASSISAHKGLKGLMGKIPGLAAKGKLIEVVATHYLGPKKSIAIVRIGGRMLVLGVTAESINLITQMGEQHSPEASLENFDLEQIAMESIATSESAQAVASAQAPAARPARDKSVPIGSGSGATSAGAPMYANPAGKHAYKAQQGSGSGSFNSALNEVSNKPSVRAQIRSRMEGMKQL